MNNGKKSCRDYDVCGNLENCLRCKGYTRKGLTPQEKAELRELNEIIDIIDCFSVRDLKRREQLERIKVEGK